MAVWTPMLALVTPGPRVTKQMPGDPVSFHAWREGERAARFEAFVGERKVLESGSISWRAQ